MNNQKDPTELYPYSKGLLFDQPNSYMYTPFNGVEFLRQYQADRLALCALLKSSAEKLDKSEQEVLSGLAKSDQTQSPKHLWSVDQNVLHNALADEKVSAIAVCNSLLGLRERGEHKKSESYKKLVAQLRRNFEVRRVLFSFYERGFKKGSEVCRDPALYARVACLCALDLRALNGQLPISLQWANVLLKLNDTLSSCSQSLTSSIDSALALISIENEMSYIENLLKIRGVAA